MTPTKPNLVTPPVGYEEVTYAEHQPEYLPLPVVRTTLDPRGRVISRWALTDGERAMIANGKDVYLELWTFGHPIQPIRLQVGGANVEPYLKSAAPDEKPSDDTKAAVA